MRLGLKARPSHFWLACATGECSNTHEISAPVPDRGSHTSLSAALRLLLESARIAASLGELSTAEWTSIFRQAGEMGALQLHLTGGEPLARADVADLVRAGRSAH